MDSGSSSPASQRNLDPQPIVGIPGQVTKSDPYNPDPFASYAPQPTATTTQVPSNSKKRLLSAQTRSKPVARASGPTSDFYINEEPKSAVSPPTTNKGWTDTSWTGWTSKRWTPSEDQRLKLMRDSGDSCREIAEIFPSRTEESIKRYSHKDMHYAAFTEDESAALLVALKEYESNRWKVIGQKIGKPAKACEQYAKEKFGGSFVFNFNEASSFTPVKALGNRSAATTRPQMTHNTSPRDYSSMKLSQEEKKRLEKEVAWLLVPPKDHNSSSTYDTTNTTPEYEMPELDYTRTTQTDINEESFSEQVTNIYHVSPMAHATKREKSDDTDGSLDGDSVHLGIDSDEEEIIINRQEYRRPDSNHNPELRSPVSRYLASSRDAEALSDQTIPMTTLGHVVDGTKLRSNEGTEMENCKHRASSDDFRGAQHTSNSSEGQPLDDYLDDTGSSESHDSAGVSTLTERRKWKILDELMDEFYCFCSGETAWRNHAGTSHSNNQQPKNQYNVPSSSASTGGSSQKRAHGDGNPSNFDDENDDNEPSRRKRQRKEGDNQEVIPPRLRKFACPFYKKHPEVYGAWQGCPGPGWETTHRVKEHLYRKHMQPIHCERCFEVFNDDASRRNHTRASVACERKEQTPFEGITAEQKERLRSRRRSVLVQTEQDRWKEMFRIIFPGVDANPVSPYYDCTTVTEHQDYLDRELPRSVERALESRLNRDLDPVVENLRSELPEIVRECLQDLFRSFRHSQVGRQIDEAGVPEATANDSDALGGKDSATESTNEGESVLEPSDIAMDQILERWGGFSSGSFEGRRDIYQDSVGNRRVEQQRFTQSSVPDINMAPEKLGFEMNTLPGWEAAVPGTLNDIVYDFELDLAPDNSRPLTAIVSQHHPLGLGNELHGTISTSYNVAALESLSNSQEFSDWAQIIGSKGKGKCWK